MENSKSNTINIWKKYLINNPYTTIILNKLNNISGVIDKKTNKYQFVVETKFQKKVESVSSILFKDNLNKITVIGIDKYCYEKLFNYLINNNGITIMNIIFILSYLNFKPKQFITKKYSGNINQTIYLF